MILTTLFNCGLNADNILTTFVGAVSLKTGISREIGSQIAQGLAQIPSAIASTTLQFEKLQTTLASTLGSKSEAEKALIKSILVNSKFYITEKKTQLYVILALIMYLTKAKLGCLSEYN